MTNLPKTSASDVNLDNGWLTISFNQPEKRNALTEELSKDIKEIFDAIKDDLSVRGVTMRGEGGIFCAGGDLKMFKTGFQGGEQGIKEEYTEILAIMPLENKDDDIDDRSLYK